ncbi:uncharacterized protein [Solanum tuberosum]|uniref:uncharacterized protein isoform X2 n=1 Tax=Solanum tuberosum TaxID=4113 RepID=UPI00073A2E48|nr:PREDICTED: uncharacterized protein LOC107062394 isoform X2 [Solanum tuberosum]
MRSEIGLKPKNQKQQLKGLRRWNFGLKKSNLNLQQQRYKEEFMDSKVRKHRCNREENEAAAEFGPKSRRYLLIFISKEESQRILGKANSASVGDASSNTRHMNEALAFFSGNNPNHNFSSSSGSSAGVSNFRSKNNSNSHLYCDYCNWKGHTKDRCYKLHVYPSDWKGKKRICNDTDSTLRTTCISSTDKWIVDSGASKHMVRNLHMLSHYKPLTPSQEGRVYLPTGKLATVSHIGSSQILGGIEITNVLHIPKFQYNLLSVSKLTKELNCTVLFNPDFCIF